MMKKFTKYLAIILCMSLITGCGSKDKEKEKDELPTNLSESINIDTEGAAAICSADNDYRDTQGYVVGSKMVIFADENDIVTKVVTQEIAMSNDESLLETVAESLERNYSSSSQYGGYNYEVTVDGNKLTSNVTIDYTEMDLKSMADDNENLNIYLNENSQYTLSTIKSMYMSVGADCN